MSTLRSLSARALALGLATLAATVFVAAPAAHAAWAPPELHLSVVQAAKEGERIPIGVTWYDDGEWPVTGTVELQSRKPGGAWWPVGEIDVVDGEGSRDFTLNGDRDVRVVVVENLTGGTTDTVSREVSIMATEYFGSASSMQLSMPSSVDLGGIVSADVTFFRGSTGVDARVNIQRRSTSGTWKHYAQFEVVDGYGSVNVRVTEDTEYRIRLSSWTWPSNLTNDFPAGTSNYVVVNALGDSAPIVFDEFRVSGAGFGHGVGMSQYGAYAMARDDYSVDEILEHYYTDTSVQFAEADQDIKVQVFGPGNGGDDRKSVRFVVNGDGYWRVRINDTYVLRESDGTGDEVVFRVSGGQVRAESGGVVTAYGNTAVFEWVGTDYVTPDSEDAPVIEVVGAQGLYRHGRLEVTSINDQVNVINRLNLNDEYLYGLAEMPSSWGSSSSGGMAALEAQAIAGRGYALLNSSVRSSCNCHLVDGPSDQNFTGWRKENEGTNAYYGNIWKQAVDNTIDGSQGKVVTYDGDVVVTHYASSTGGATENSEEVWVSALPWERSVDDPWSLDPVNPYRSWNVTVSQSRMQQIFEMSDIVAVRITSRSEGGSALRLVATSATGETSWVSGNYFYGSLGLRSRYVNSVSGVL